MDRSPRSDRRDGIAAELASTEALVMIGLPSRATRYPRVVSTHESITPGTLTSMLKEARRAGARTSGCVAS